jgi:hypothetical protein
VQKINRFCIRLCANKWDKEEMMVSENDIL